ncbi:MAG: peptidyl-prolyl cis-trans isomerase [Planctomycetaceae bacterium]|nr:peptidyl-prolyl cis-trans isomerase [Planctomycetaceae bacterium]
MNFRIRHSDRPPIERWLSAASLAMLLCAGCSGRSVTADNPVVGMIPPRMAVAESGPEVTRSQDKETSVTQVGHVDGGDGSLDAEMSEVAAVVNGTPILVADVLEPISIQLAQAKSQLSPEEFVKVREQAIRQLLPQMIDQAVLVDGAVSQLGADQKEQLETQLDALFTQRLEEVKTEKGVGTLAELEALMQQQGTTLSNMRRAFGRQSMAQQSLLLHMPAEPVVSRQELLAEYEKRIDDYKQPAQVKWQQIWIAYDKHGGKSKALALLDAAIAELKNGADFETVARKYSDGVMAQEGGHWDWTQKGSLANEEIERMLFALNVGEIGEVVAGDKAYQLVRVTQRRPDRVTPFEEVQEEIREEILNERKRGVEAEVVKKLKKDAVITTMFDAS